MSDQKLENLLLNAGKQVGYERWLDQFILPLLSKIGLTTSVKRRKDTWTITIRFP